MSQKPYVLWVTSWYPCATNLYNGDFIQRQARAVSAFEKLVVVHVEIVDALPLPAPTVQVNEGVEEHLLYLYAGKKSLAGKLMLQLRYTQKWKRYLKDLFARHGLPAFVHAHIPVKVGSIARYLRKRYGLPYLLSEHYGIYNEEAADRYALRNSFFKYQTRQAVREADRLLVVSDSLGRQMNQWVLAKPYTVIPNVVDTHIFRFLGKVPSAETGLHFLHASTMNQPKNVYGLLRAFNAAYLMNTGLRLTMAGLATQDCIEYAARLEAANNIVFTGHLSQQQLAVFMQRSHAFVLFSHHENLPSVLLEAHCCGLPCITTAVGGIAEIVLPADSVVAAGDEQALAEAFLHWKPITIAERETLSAACIHKYCMHTIGQALARIYTGVGR